MVNMIQSYINNNNHRTQPKAQNQDVEIVNVQKVKPHFDIHKELANRTFIKPLPGQGRLVKSKITDMPAVWLKNTAYSLKALKDGYSGKANDHQLGKLNDMGLVIGGLGLAGYLATIKQTPKTKAMEFIGLASFLASMSLWPKIAIQWPAQLIHGHNVFQKYEDSFGRKKDLHQDPQFIPFDLYTDDEINKIGDRMGVPKDIPNRRAFIEEKMRKLGVQNNTLWMLTAGFATPVMSALICNRAEPYVQKYLNNMQMKKADNMLNHFAESTKAQTSDKIIKNIESLIELHKDHTIDDKLIRKMAVNLTDGLDGLTTEAVEADLHSILKPGGKDKYTIASNAAASIIENAKQTLKNAEIDAQIIDAVVPTGDQLTNMFDNNGYSGKAFTKLELQDVLDDISILIRKNINAYNNTCPAQFIDGDYKKIIIDRLFSGKFDSAPVSKVLISMPAAKFTPEVQSVLKNVAKIMTDFKARTDVLDKYAFKKFASAPETGLANYWNDVAESLIKIFKFSPKEIENTRMDRELMTALLREKMEKIAADGDEYKRVLKAVCEKINTMKDTVKTDVLPENYTKAVNTTYDTVAGALEKVEFGENRYVSLDKTLQHFIGPKALRNNQIVHTDNCSLKQIQQTFAEDRLLGIKSTFNGIIESLNFYRKIATKSNLTSLEGRPREIKEEGIEFAKQLSVDRHAADFETKFYMHRNPYPNMDDVSDIEVKDGKVINKYFKKNDIKNVDIPQDWDFFQMVMKMLYDDPLHKDTLDILKETNITGLEEHRKALLNEIGNTNYFAKPFHVVNGNGSFATSERKFLLLGMSPDDLFSKIGLRKYNSNKWFKIFGTVGAVLLGVTLASQFFFGKLKPPEKGQKG